MSSGTRYLLFAVIQRFHIFRILPLAALLAATTVKGADAQDSVAPERAVAALPVSTSLLDAPVLGGDPDLPDITYVRGAIHPVHADDGVRIALDVHLAADPVPDSLYFPWHGLRIDSVRVDGRAVTPSIRSARLAVPVTPDSISSPVEADSMPGNRIAAAYPTPENELRVTLFYAVESGLNRRTDDGESMAVWTSPGGGYAGWLPLPSSSDDLFHVDLAIALPGDWTLVHGSPEEAPADDAGADRVQGDADAMRIHLLRPNEAVTSHDVGFAAVRTDMLRTVMTEGENPVGGAGASGADFGVIASLGTGILGRPADSVRTDIDEMVDFLDETLALSTANDALIHLLIGGSPGGPVGSGVTVHGDDRPAADAPWLTDFHAGEALTYALVGPSLTRIPTTDIWIRHAVVAWLTALHTRSTSGEAAFADVMEELATAYISETDMYQRPLVWDRWSLPLDLADAHARGKGAWVLQMIEAVVGREAMLAGVDEFLDLPDDRLRDSEALRESIEAYSDEDLSAFFDAWVYGAGHPVLNVSTSHDAAGEQLTVRIEQNQDGPLVPAAFPMRPGVRFASIEGTRNELLTIDDAVATASFRASIAPTYFHIDTAAAWLFQFTTPPPPDDLVSRLRHDDSPASRVRTYRILSRGAADSGLLFGARPVIAGETDPIARAIGLDVPAAMAPAPSAERMLLEYVQDASPIVRARALQNLFPFETPAVGEAALRAANTESDPLVLSAAVPVLIARRPAIAWNVIESALVTASPGHRVRLTALHQIAGVEHDNRERLSTLMEHTGPGQPFALRRTAAIEAAMTFPGESGVARLAGRWLSAEEALLRQTAIDMLTFMPADVVTELVEGASSFDADPRVRRGLQTLRSVSDTG